MEYLPSSIEQYLLDAGFTGTEVVILNALLEKSGRTLREIANATAKSTGVLDSGVKKLMKKKIVTKESVNGQFKYHLKSVQSVLQWMEEDVKLRQEAMNRRHQNFSSFIESIDAGKVKPEMEHFEGEEGLKQCYQKLLRHADKELLRYFPVSYKEEEDPLRDFRVQYFRERRKHNVFSRVIAHNTSLGRRFQSRDAFEYRQTKLVPENSYPFTFEKIIAGDMVACIDLKEHTACLIQYPEMAGVEKSLFEGIWKHESLQQTVEKKKQEEEPEKPDVPFATETISQIRDFFLSKRSIATVCALGVIAAGVTYGLYRHNVALNTEHVRERARSIAATAALQFDPADLNELRTPEDIKKPEYAKVIYQLNEIRRQNDGLTYIYILRPTENPNIVTFIADADSLNPYEEKDLNGDGVIDDADWLSPPGEEYDVSNQPALQRALREGAHTADSEPYKDQWGTWISGHGPIFDETGKPIAIIGADINANRVEELTRDAFVPIYWFFGLFFLFLLIRLAAFNRSLLDELIPIIQSGRMILFIGVATGLACVVTVLLYQSQKELNTQRIREAVTSIAATAAPRFNADTIELLQTEADVNRPEYAQVVLELAKVQRENPRVEYVYLLRPTKDAATFQFIAASDALDPSAAVDSNGDGQLDSADELVVPGQPYDVSSMDALLDRAYNVPVANRLPYTDQWGTFYTGYAPVRNGSGKVVAVLSVDIEQKELAALNTVTFIPFFVLLAVFVLLLLFKGAAFSSSLLYKLLSLFSTKVAVLWLLFVITFLGGAVFWLNQYVEHLRIQETGKRLMAIASTAAPLFNPEDLEQLHWARDMATPAYQRVFATLNDIRERNPEIRYAYIFRPTEVDGIWEFIADADSNFYLEALFVDHNKDHVLDDADINVYPGMAYDISSSSPDLYAFGKFKPVYEKSLTIDQWGVFITGGAPILDNDGSSIAVLGLDVIID